ncbi:hypothetical protein AMAG_19235 [Allomyces macrogynus ATCC 38327]|uniref:Uncharacterized protein n=1 Tax=Allomyces macrogynus (strain ATCC 38327) TaxID=578462 RepID=A0A0L0STT3_ALLM3|nr:hypothetical protein AMAG_19235 [Allomyces macrogynus ATCC 38327]|eukprot:KNE65901.1 hypothetical protein AMAG_19235 [Allomyces macrogynus ATCC 38327]
MDELGTYTFEKTGFKITWAEKPVTAPCAIPEEDEEEEEKTPEEQISEFIINEFKTKGYAKDADMIYVASKANPYYFEPLMSVTEYVSYILDEVFIEYFNKNARKYALHVNARLSHGSKNIRQYKPNRFKITWAEKPVTAPCAIPEEDEEEEEKTPEEQISEFIINEFKTKGYAKDADMIYVASKANPYYFEPLMSVTEYVSYILDEVFIEYFNKNARKYALHVNARLSHGSKNIRQYKPNRSLIAFKNGVLFTGTATNRQWGLFSLEDIAKDSERFEKEICNGCPVAWNYIDNDFDFSVPRSQWTDMDIGPYRDVLELQMGTYPEAIKQYMMLAFGRSCFPVAH